MESITTKERGRKPVLEFVTNQYSSSFEADDGDEQYYLMQLSVCDCPNNSSPLTVMAVNPRVAINCNSLYRVHSQCRDRDKKSVKVVFTQDYKTRLLNSTTDSLQDIT